MKRTRNYKQIIGLTMLRQNRFLRKLISIPLVIAILCVVGYLINVAIFFPGFMSADSLSQLYQSTGLNQFTTLHPPIMVLTWRLLIYVTGNVASLLLLQLLLLWGAIYLMSLYVLFRTKNRLFSLALVTLPFFPILLNISGVIWKDVLMAYLLLLGVVLSLWLPYVSKKRLRVCALVLVLCLFTYAALLRYNVLPAIVPLIMVALQRSGLVLSRRRYLLGVAAITFVMGLSFFVLNAVSGAKNIDIKTGMLLDDIIATANNEEIQQRVSNDDLRRIIIKTKNCKEATPYNVIGALLLPCVGEQDKTKILLDYHSQIAQIWKQTIPKHLTSYIGYKAFNYVSFIFPQGNYGYIWQNGIGKNSYNLEVANKQLAASTQLYVESSYKNFTFLYEPWFWLAISSVIGAQFARKNFDGRHILLALGSSSLLLVLSYIPSGATNDFRYIYWSVIACLLAGIIFVIDLCAPGKPKEHTRK